MPMCQYEIKNKFEGYEGLVYIAGQRWHWPFLTPAPTDIALTNARNLLAYLYDIGHEPSGICVLETGGVIVFCNDILTVECTNNGLLSIANGDLNMMALCDALWPTKVEKQ